MNIRIMGSPDIVLGWKAMLEREYGIFGAVYKNRGTGGGCAHISTWTTVSRPKS